MSLVEDLTKLNQAMLVFVIQPAIYQVRHLMDIEEDIYQFFLSSFDSNQNGLNYRFTDF